jgi:hypothetical protein
MLNSCKKEITRVEATDIPLNPYGNIDYGNNPGEIPIDSASYLGLHKFIFSKKCGVPGCHDGSFEPDFRTIEGSYNQLVYHGVIKNNATNDFTYRVIPGDTAMSWLHERITTDDANLGKMPLYDVMSENEIKQVETWILNGAKNVFDVNPNLPNLQPSSGGVLAYLNDTSGIRLDTARASIIAPMQFPQNSTVQLWFLLYDTDQNGDFLPSYNFTYNKIRVSDHPYDYTGVPYNSLNVLPALGPANLPLPFGGGSAPFFYHNYNLNTANYIPGKTYYFRIYTKDADHTFNTEIPKTGTQLYLITYFSFIVQ